MLLIAIVAVVLCLAVFLSVWVSRQRTRRELEQNSIDAEVLHGLIEAQQKVAVYDVRQPLDLLAHTEIIPGSVRIPPKDLLDNPSLIPREEDAVVYCTCDGEKTSRAIVRHARSLNFTRLKLLRGGLAAWKAKGYPVERYDRPFHLDTAS